MVVTSRSACCCDIPIIAFDVWRAQHLISVILGDPVVRVTFPLIGNFRYIKIQHDGESYRTQTKKMVYSRLLIFFVCVLKDSLSCWILIYRKWPIYVCIFRRYVELRHMRMRITLLITSTTVVESRELFEFGEEMISFRSRFYRWAGDSVLPFSVFLHG